VRRLLAHMRPAFSLLYFFGLGLALAPLTWALSAVVHWLAQ
jgi:hypothetical protein